MNSISEREARSLLKDLNTCLDTEAHDWEDFIVILNNYVNVETPGDEY